MKSRFSLTFLLMTAILLGIPAFSQRVYADTDIATPIAFPADTSSTSITSDGLDTTVTAPVETEQQQIQADFTDSLDKFQDIGLRMQTALDQLSTTNPGIDTSSVSNALTVAQTNLADAQITLDTLSEMPTTSPKTASEKEKVSAQLNSTLLKIETDLESARENLIQGLATFQTILQTQVSLDTPTT